MMARTSSPNAVAPTCALTIIGQQARVPGMLSRMRHRLFSSARSGLAATKSCALIASG